MPAQPRGRPDAGPRDHGARQGRRLPGAAGGVSDERRTEIQPVAAAGKHRARGHPRALRRDPGQAQSAAAADRGHLPHQRARARLGHGRHRLRAGRCRADRARRRRQEDRHLPAARRLRRLQVDGADGEAVRRKIRLQGRGDDVSGPALSRRSEARLAGRHHPCRRHRAHADLAQGRAHHARPVRGRARHLDAHALRHPHGGARQARHASSTTAWRRGRSRSRKA